MIYVPKKPQLIHAFKFTTVNEESIKHNIKNVPSNIQGNCQCGYPIYMHGYYNNRLVCPNMYIMYEGNTVVNVMSPENFESIYRPLSNNDDIIEVCPMEVNEEDGKNEEGNSTGTVEDIRGEETSV